MMLIVCPSCATAYQIDLAALGGAGRSVRCARCKNTWFATAESAVPAEPAMAAATATPPADRAPEEQPSIDHIPDDIVGNFVVDAEVAQEPASGDTSDAVEPVFNAPSIVPAAQPETSFSTEGKFDPGTPDDALAARRERRNKSKGKTPGDRLRQLASLPALIVALIGVLTALVHWRGTVVRYLPQTASLFAELGLPVNLRGLVFEGVKSIGEFHDGMMVLVVEGSIVNMTRTTLEVPRMRFAVRNGGGHEVYAWTALPTHSLLAGGETLPFRTRLASPPPDAREVIVRFFNRRDIAANAK